MLFHEELVVPPREFLSEAPAPFVERAPLLRRGARERTHGLLRLERGLVHGRGQSAQAVGGVVPERVEAERDRGRGLDGVFLGEHGGTWGGAAFVEHGDAAGTHLAELGDVLERELEELEQLVAEVVVEREEAVLGQQEQVHVGFGLEREEALGGLELAELHEVDVSEVRALLVGGEDEVGAPSKL